MTSYVPSGGDSVEVWNSPEWLDEVPPPYGRPIAEAGNGPGTDSISFGRRPSRVRS